MPPPTELDAATRPTRVRWLVFALACLVSWFLYLHRYSWSVIKKDVKTEFGLSDVELGWLDSFFQGAYALCQIPGGFLGDRFGPLFALPLMIAGWSVLVLAPGMAGGMPALAGARTLFGVAQAGAYPTLGKVTRSWFPLSVRTTLQGLVASFSGRAGGACAALLVGTLLMGILEMDWRSALAVIAIAGLGFALVFGRLFRDRPAEHPRVNEAERLLIESGEREAAAGDENATRLDLRAPVLISFGFLLFQLFASTFADILYVYWVPLFLEEAKGFAKIEMGIFASLPLFVSAVGGVVGGSLNDLLVRWGMSRPASRRLVGFTGKLVAAGFVVASLSVDDGRWCMVVLAAGKFFSDWTQPTVWGTLTDIGGRATGKVFGTANTVGALGGFAAGPIFGAVKQDLGWEMLFWTVAAVYVMAGLSWLGVDSSRRILVERDPPG